jgi:prepilin-type N-terminal cleavage/methylation domain-containing protein
MSRTNHALASRRRGFTLLELMVSLAVGGIALTSMYAIAAATTRNFHQQRAVASTQSSLRTALTRVKRDIARAGYLASPNANQLDPNTGQPVESCAAVGSPLHNPSVDGALAGISRFINNVAPATTPVASGLVPQGSSSTDNQTAGFTRDEIRLIANYETSDQYRILENPDNRNNSVLVPQGFYSYTRDFTRWYSPTDTALTDAAKFDEAFTVGRMVRILTGRLKKHFAVISDVTKPGEAPQGVADPAIIDFNQPIPSTCSGEINQGWIAPVSVIRYFIADAPATETRTEANLAAALGTMTQLVRQEVLPDNKGTALSNNPANTRAILDYAVGFNLRFELNGAGTSGGLPDNYTLGTFTDVQNTINANPERVRAVEIDLSARTPLSDPKFTWTAARCAAQSCFQVFPVAQNQGAARVRRARALVFLPNIAYEGY